MLSALDPLGLPVVTDVLPGQRADDPLYVPAITRVRESLERRGLLYVGEALSNKRVHLYSRCSLWHARCTRSPATTNLSRGTRTA